VPDNPEELKLKLAIADHAKCCPNLTEIGSSAKRLRELNGIDKTVAHHEQTLYGDDRGLLMRMDRVEKEAVDMGQTVDGLKGTVGGLRDAHLKIIGAMSLLSIVGGIFVWIGFERLMRAVNAVAAVPK
jgi:hypothetical protein